jgi:hypothetical protein
MTALQSRGTLQRAPTGTHLPGKFLQLRGRFKGMGRPRCEGNGDRVRIEKPSVQEENSSSVLWLTSPRFRGSS